MASAATQLLDLMAARFALITVANGYTEPFRSIKRARLTPFEMQDLPALNYWASDSALETKEYSFEVWQLGVIVNAYTATRDNPFLDIASRLADDLITGMHRLPSAPLTSNDEDNGLYNGDGDMVGELFVTRAAYAFGEGQKPYCGCAIECFIRYHVATGSPSVLLVMN